MTYECRKSDNANIFVDKVNVYVDDKLIARDVQKFRVWGRVLSWIGLAIKTNQGDYISKAGFVRGAILRKMHSTEGGFPFTNVPKLEKLFIKDQYKAVHICLKEKMAAASWGEDLFEKKRKEEALLDQSIIQAVWDKVDLSRLSSLKFDAKN